MSQGKHSISGIQLLRQLASESVKIFTVSQAREVAGHLGIPLSYVNEALHYLQQSGWIWRIKRGVYAFTAESGFGVPPHEFEIAMALVTPCAVSHWTAMHYHHLTEQTPNTIFAITPTGTSIPRSVKGTLYHFIQIKPAHYFGIEKIWVDQAQVQITDPERTLLDGLMLPHYCGDFQEVLHAFKMHSEKIRIQLIVEYALKLDCATAKRLGWILEKLGIDLSQLTSLLKMPIKGYRKLDPSSPSAGLYNKKWMIQENIRFQ